MTEDMIAWEKLSTSLSSLPLQASSPSGSTGESVGVRGELTRGGVGIHLGVAYGLVWYMQVEFGLLCGGKIGSGHWVSVKPRSLCGVSAHGKTRFAWSGLVGAISETAAVFIKGSAGDEDHATVFASPVLPGRKLPKAAWEELELSLRSLESWQATFQSLLQQEGSGGEMEDPQTKAVLFADTKTAAKFAYTPCKRSAGDQDEPLIQGFRIKLAPVEKNIGDKATPAIQRLTNGGLWSDLVGNLEIVHANVAQLGINVLKQLKAVDETLDSVEYCLSVLKALVGDRPDLLGTASVFETLELLVERVGSSGGNATPLTSQGLDMSDQQLTEEEVKSIVEEQVLKVENILRTLQTTLPSALSAEVKRGIHDKLFAGSSSFQTNFAHPTMLLLCKWSTGPAQPGDKLEQAMHQVDQRVASVKAAVQQLRATNRGPPSGPTAPPASNVSFSPFTWSMANTPANVGQSAGGQATAGSVSGVSVGSTVDLVALSEAVRRLRDDVDSIWDQMEAEAVDIATETFQSKSECATWLATQNAEAAVYLFVDPILFLSLCTCDAPESEQDAANQRATTVKIRDTNLYQTAFIGSYSLEVPPLLGKGVHADATRAMRTLAAAPTFKDFHPGGGREGIKEKIMYYVKDGMKTLDFLLGDAFNKSSAAYIVARAMMTASYVFWDEFCRWIIIYHKELLGKSNASSKEVWSLISHCVQAVFKSICTARACSRAFHTAEGMFWGALQAHHVMEDYKDNEFSGNPKIALTLHEHLIIFFTPLSKFVHFQAKHKKELRELREKIEKA